MLLIAKLGTWLLPRAAQLMYNPCVHNPMTFACIDLCTMSTAPPALHAGLVLLTRIG